VEAQACVKEELIKVYQATNGNVRNSDTHGQDGSKVQVNMLYWATLGHYDCGMNIGLLKISLPAFSAVAQAKARA
jgi:hypothetical protein